MTDEPVDRPGPEDDPSADRPDQLPSDGARPPGEASLHKKMASSASKLLVRQGLVQGLSAL